LNNILLGVPKVLDELMTEFVRRGDEEYRNDETSQRSACFFLAIRSVSLLCAMGKLLTPQTRDSMKVLARGFLESRDLLMTFRFEDQSIRNKIGYWFEGKMDSSWKAEHTRCEQLFTKLAGKSSEFSKKWSQTTALAHPTRFAAQNSVACATTWAAIPLRREDYSAVMEPEVADYLTSIASLIVMATYDLPGLISLECDLSRMPTIDTFKQLASDVAVPILDRRIENLPPSSYRT